MNYSSNLKRTVAALATLPLACCIPPAAETTPTPPPSKTAPTPAPAPARPAAVADSLPSNWMDQPATPGDWNYTSNSAISLAQFGPTNIAEFSLRCNRESRNISIYRKGISDRPLSMTIATETQTRTLNAVNQNGSFQALVARIPASDPLFDAMAFSKGRFAVAVPGLQVVYVPAWAEVTRVMEDCR